MKRFYIGDWVRHRQSGLVGQLHHWVEDGACVRLHKPEHMCTFYEADAEEGGLKTVVDCVILVSHVVLLDARVEFWERVSKPK
jgi:hypothetical protein